MSQLPLLLGAFTTVVRVPGVVSFVIPSRCTTHGSCGAQWESSNGQEPDLFEYFDPLLSPHAYPDGVAPENKPQPEAVANHQSQRQKSAFANPFGIDYMSQKRQSEVPPAEEPVVAASTTTEADVPDLFDYFDPLASPHSYPNGIQPPSQQSKPQALEADERYNPLQMDSVAMSRSSVSAPTKKVGILLMDHGSRNPASNARLEKLAELYQLTLDEGEGTNTQMIVEAAHMEIAKPSIPDGLQTLLDQGVDEIVCHPFFLSPGRHVQEDIPEIVNQAIKDLKIDIPIVTTDPVGSNTQLMIGAIHDLVREKSPTLKSQRK